MSRDQESRRSRPPWLQIEMSRLRMKASAFPSMPVIRFVREGRDVECFPGENLREVALREGIELYGLKGKLGNCGGCGQCITCFVAVVDEAVPGALSARTSVEERKLRRRPQDWRLACQALVERSVAVLTRPQVGLPEAERILAEARLTPLPAGPTAWPAPQEEDLPATATADEERPEASTDGDTVR
jgi:ferredoxin